MDWALAIERNSKALKGIVETLFAMLGLVGEGTVSRIPKPLHRAVLLVLWPAESAMRRLIVIAARGLVVKLKRPVLPPRPAKPTAKSGESRPPSFQLFDPRKRFKPVGAMKSTWIMPRIHVISPPDPTVASIFAARAARASSPAPAAAPAPPSDGLVNAGRLTRRLQALKLALEDLPRQARRLARLLARREKVPTLKFKSPLRPGRAPGSRKKPTHQVDEVLTECHWLAWEALKPDTS